MPLWPQDNFTPRHLNHGRCKKKALISPLLPESRRQKSHIKDVLPIPEGKTYSYHQQWDVKAEIILHKYHQNDFYFPLVSPYVLVTFPQLPFIIQLNIKVHRFTTFGSSPPYEVSHVMENLLNKFSHFCLITLSFVTEPPPRSNIYTDLFLPYPILEHHFKDAYPIDYYPD